MGKVHIHCNKRDGILQVLRAYRRRLGSFKLESRNADGEIVKKVSFFLK